ncbi:hypothetical protein [Rubripirellula lacrimiformis]|uniref:hypothetical protein n=1 Tax=Rubripirellula lacrimiformis TaxID=1930273 RepID=UPI001C54C91B|nr:hypothetical protein [Rubripirellula lacrimiformis]
MPTSAADSFGGPRVANRIGIFAAAKLAGDESGAKTLRSLASESFSFEKADFGELFALF